MSFKEISADALVIDPCKKIGKDWFLLAASKKGDGTNAMTAGWGGIGFMWGKPVFFSVIRPQRYTKEFVDASDTFSASFFSDDFKNTLSYFGKVSGRAEDKIKNSALTLLFDGDTPYFSEAQTVFILRKIYRQTFSPDCFLEKEYIDKNYPMKDFHDMYISEIVKILVKS